MYGRESDPCSVSSSPAYVLLVSSPGEFNYVYGREGFYQQSLNKIVVIWNPGITYTSLRFLEPYVDNLAVFLCAFSIRYLRGSPTPVTDHDQPC